MKYHANKEIIIAAFHQQKVLVAFYSLLDLKGSELRTKIIVSLKLTETIIVKQESYASLYNKNECCRPDG